jgi:TPR repeat protein
MVAGVTGLALLAGIGLTVWRFTNDKTSTKSSTVQASAAGSPSDQLRDAAEAGDAAAQYDLAMRYLKGDGVAQSDSDAATWLLKAAHLGSSSAQLQLGVAYELGRGVPQDFVKAYACYLIAGANGNAGSDAAQQALTPKLTMRQIAEGRTLLGEMYQGGIGTPVDNVQAYMWFTLAQAAGSKAGQREKALLASKLTKEQIETASRSAAERLNGTPERGGDGESGLRIAIRQTQ